MFQSKFLNGVVSKIFESELVALGGGFQSKFLNGVVSKANRCRCISLPKNSFNPSF